MNQHQDEQNFFFFFSVNERPVTLTSCCARLFHPFLSYPVLNPTTCTEDASCLLRSAFLSSRVTPQLHAHPALHLLCKNTSPELTTGAGAASDVRQDDGFLLGHLHFGRRTQRGFP